MSFTNILVSEGHLVDSGNLTRILNLVVEEGGDYEILSFRIGKTNLDISRLELEVRADTEELLRSLTDQLINLGCYEREVGEALLRQAPTDRHLPEDFYSTTNHRTEVYLEGAWRPVQGQRMDCAVVVTPEALRCRKLRDIHKGDRVVCGTRSVRLFPQPRERESGEFGFMESEVSSEKSTEVAVRRVAYLLEAERRQGRVIAVAGPAVVHTGGGPALAALIRQGYLHGLLAGNALAVHDLESVLYGTSLGVELKTGRPTHEGHRNHMRAIARIYRHGSIAAAVEAGEIGFGIMYEVVHQNLPCVLAGSLRDDGPLPETVTDMIEAQERYEQVLQGATAVLLMSSMLHAIAVGNMISSRVKTICVDINPAVVAKLSDRGSSQAVSVVTDVGLFLRSLASCLEPRERG